jgi:hypothetical protein
MELRKRVAGAGCKQHARCRRDVRRFRRPFQPERVRVVFPNRKGEFLDEKEVLGNARRLRRIPVAVCWINAQDVAAKGLFLADFFAF